jgi:hypothetical protein
MPAVSPEVFHSQWDNVFLNPALPATIEYVDDAEQNYSLSMHYSDLDRGVALPGTQALVKGSGMASAPTSVSPLVMVRRKSGEPERKIEITVNSFNQITYDPVTGPLGPPVAYFPSTVMYADSDNVLWFSQLSVANNEGGVVDAMRRIFPQITNLMILSLFGSQRMFAETAGKKLPLALVSAGMHKVLSLALALISYKKGLVVLDEMENGIFHERYADVWSLMHHLAVQYDTQVFVSSHSLECLEALIPVIKDHEPDFALFRTSNTASGPNIERVAGSALRAALEGRGEVR